MTTLLTFEHIETVSLITFFIITYFFLFCLLDYQEEEYEEQAVFDSVLLIIPSICVPFFNTFRLALTVTLSIFVKNGSNDFLHCFFTSLTVSSIFLNMTRSVCSFGFTLSLSIFSIGWIYAFSGLSSSASSSNSSSWSISKPSPWPSKSLKF